MIYVLSFSTLSALLFAVDSRPSRDIIKRFVISLAVLVPCCVAGFRALNIGTDTSVYAYPMYKCAIASDSFFSYYESVFMSGWHQRPISSIEVGFSLLVFVVAKCARSFQVLLFLVQFLTIAPIFSALYSMRQKYPLWIGAAVYYFLFFGSSLNIMRQWVAIAFMLLAMVFFFSNKKSLSVIALIAGISFHYSLVLISICLLSVWYLLRGARTSRQSEKRLALIAVLGILIISNLNSLSGVLSRLGFGSYSSGYLNGSLGLSVNQIVLRLPALCVYLYCFHKTRKEEWNTLEGFFLAMFILDLFASQMGTVSGQSLRISFYFGSFQILGLPYFIYNEKKKRTILTALLIGYLCIYWYVYYVIYGYSSIYPYEVVRLY